MGRSMRNECKAEKNGLRMLCLRGMLAGLLCVCALAALSPVKALAESAGKDALGALMKGASALVGSVQQEASESETPSGTEDDPNYNILLVGSDRRDDSWNGNSDTMILVTIKEGSSQISMISFMRDLGVSIPGLGTQKLNAAFAAGGISLLEDTLRTNFNVDIDNYITVDFYEMIDIVDALGGVDMEVRDEEIDNVNMYIMSMCPYMGLNESDYLLSSGGMLHLNGMQAVAFCRVRFVGDNDYERTERQRRVLTALLNSVDPKDQEDVLTLLKTLLLDVENDLSPLDLLKIAPLMMHMSDYGISSGRVPFDGLYSSQGEMLMPVQPDTNERLHSLMNGEE